MVGNLHKNGYYTSYKTSMVSPCKALSVSLTLIENIQYNQRESIMIMLQRVFKFKQAPAPCSSLLTYIIVNTGYMCDLQYIGYLDDIPK